MKIKTFTGDDIRLFSSAKKVTLPLLTISITSGTFLFNASAQALLGLTVKSMVLVHQDEDEPKDWYLEIVKKGGIELRAKKASEPGRDLLFQSCGLARIIASTVDGLPSDFKSGRLQVGKEPVKVDGRMLYPLLTGRLVTDLIKK